MKTEVRVEKPMLFSSAMVLRLLDGSKNQTRRVVKPQPVFQGVQHFGDSWSWTKGQDSFKGVTTEQLVGPAGLCHESRCPHPVGSFIWCKETFYDSSKESKHHPITYRADISVDEDLSRDFKWKPSIFMPRKFSRITLEVTGVRVERLNDISEEDAKAEGVSYPAAGPNSCYRMAYSQLWESINGKGSWEKNPWVWCFTFKRIKP